MFESYISFPNIDPVFFSLGPLQIRWYALAYVVGVVFTWRYARWILTRKPEFGIAPSVIDDLLPLSIFGVIIGGRLGYILFYDVSYFLERPWQVFMVWQGGMSFHGGLLGVLVSFFFYSYQKNLSFLRLLDLIGLGAPVGVFLGRVANFINGELYGRITDVPWAILFPKGGYLPRHPSQLYEAILEGAFIFFVLNVCFWQTKMIEKPGKISGLGLILYVLARFIVEYFREPDAHLGFVLLHFSMGQLLSVPYLFLGLYFYLRK